MRTNQLLLIAMEIGSWRPAHSIKKRLRPLTDHFLLPEASAATFLHSVTISYRDLTASSLALTIEIRLPGAELAVLDRGLPS